MELKAQSKILTPAYALALSLLLTFGAAFFAYRSAQSENRGRFDRAAGNFVTSLKNRMTVYTNALNYTRNLFYLKPGLSEAEFREFVVGMQLCENFPGIQTIGYVTRQGSADVVKYVERMYEDANRVKGMNLSVSPERKAAMDRARDLGEPVATNRVYPLQKTGNPEEYAFLVFVPHYRKGANIETVEQRRQAIEGFVYGGFRTTNLFGRLSDLLRFRQTSFLIDIFDGEGFVPGHLMFTEGDRSTADISLQKDLELALANHTWSVRITAPQGFTLPNLRYNHLIILAVGCLLSAMIALALRRSQRLSKSLHDANQAKSIFLANISHEIRTPLGAMVGFAEIALQQNDKAERDDSLRAITRNGRQLTRIIGDVLDLSKIEANSLEIALHPFSLHDLLEDLLKSWSPQFQAKGVRFELDADPTLPSRIISDDTRIRQILTNLMSNALKFTDKGRVRLEVKRLPDGPRLEFTVKDSGLGIPEIIQRKLFVPFSQGDSSITRRFGGSGLGLALSREFARAMKGSLELTETSSKGSSFTLTLPLETAPDEQQENSKMDNKETQLHGVRVLLVEDSEDNQLLISLMLKKAGAEVDLANDGREGVSKALNGRYQVVLMDIQMPVLDGSAAMAELKQQGFTTPVVALTAHALHEEREKALKLGFKDYLTKPIDRALMLRTIARLAQVELQAENSSPTQSPQV